MSILKKMNILGFIGEHIGSLISILLILFFIGSIGLNSYFWMTNTKGGEDFSEKIKNYKYKEDSLEVYIAILDDSINIVKKKNDKLLSNKNTLELSLIELELETKALEDRLHKIKSLKIDSSNKKLTNEEIDIWLHNKFGPSK